MIMTTNERNYNNKELHSNDERLSVTNDLQN